MMNEFLVSLIKMFPFLEFPSKSFLKFSKGLPVTNIIPSTIKRQNVSFLCPFKTATSIEISSHLEKDDSSSDEI